MAATMSTTDKFPWESWFDYWNRKHDARHPEGQECQCAWNQVNLGRRYERRYGE